METSTGMTDVMRWLLDYSSGDGHTPEGLTHLLQERHECVNIGSADGTTALHIAFQPCPRWTPEDHTAVINSLLSYGANMHLADEAGLTPLSRLAPSPHKEFVLSAIAGYRESADAAAPPCAAPLSTILDTDPPSGFRCMTPSCVSEHVIYAIRGFSEIIAWDMRAQPSQGGGFPGLEGTSAIPVSVHVPSAEVHLLRGKLSVLSEQIAFYQREANQENSGGDGAGLPTPSPAKTAETLCRSHSDISRRLEAVLSEQPIGSFSVFSAPLKRAPPCGPPPPEYIWTDTGVILEVSFGSGGVVSKEDALTPEGMNQLWTMYIEYPIGGGGGDGSPVTRPALWGSEKKKAGLGSLYPVRKAVSRVRCSDAPRFSTGSGGLPGILVDTLGNTICLARHLGKAEGSALLHGGLNATASSVETTPASTCLDADATPPLHPLMFCTARTTLFPPDTSVLSEERLAPLRGGTLGSTGGGKLYGRLPGESQRSGGGAKAVGRGTPSVARHFITSEGEGWSGGAGIASGEVDAAFESVRQSLSFVGVRKCGRGHYVFATESEPTVFHSGVWSRGWGGCVGVGSGFPITSIEALDTQPSRVCRHGCDRPLFAVVSKTVLILQISNEAQLENPNKSEHPTGETETQGGDSTIPTGASSCLSSSPALFDMASTYVEQMGVSRGPAGGLKLRTVFAIPRDRLPDHTYYVRFHPVEDSVVLIRAGVGHDISRISYIDSRCAMLCGVAYSSAADEAAAAVASSPPCSPRHSVAAAEEGDDGLRDASHPLLCDFSNPAAVAAAAAATSPASADAGCANPLHSTPGVPHSGSTAGGGGVIDPHHASYTFCFSKSGQILHRLSHATGALSTFSWAEIALEGLEARQATEGGWSGGLNNLSPRRPQLKIRSNDFGVPEGLQDGSYLYREGQEGSSRADSLALQYGSYRGGKSEGDLPGSNSGGSYISQQRSSFSRFPLPSGVPLPEDRVGGSSGASPEEGVSPAPYRNLCYTRPPRDDETPLGEEHPLPAAADDDEEAYATLCRAAEEQRKNALVPSFSALVLLGWDAGAENPGGDDGLRDCLTLFQRVVSSEGGQPVLTAHCAASVPPRDLRMVKAVARFPTPLSALSCCVVSLLRCHERGVGCGGAVRFSIHFSRQKGDMFVPPSLAVAASHLSSAEPRSICMSADEVRALSPFATQASVFPTDIHLRRIGDDGAISGGTADTFTSSGLCGSLSSALSAPSEMTWPVTHPKATVVGHGDTLLSVNRSTGFRTLRGSKRGGGGRAGLYVCVPRYPNPDEVPEYVPKRQRLFWD